MCGDVRVCMCGDVRVCMYILTQSPLSQTLPRWEGPAI